MPFSVPTPHSPLENVALPTRIFAHLLTLNKSSFFFCLRFPIFILRAPFHDCRDPGEDTRPSTLPPGNAGPSLSLGQMEEFKGLQRQHSDGSSSIPFGAHNWEGVGSAVGVGVGGDEGGVPGIDDYLAREQEAPPSALHVVRRGLPWLIAFVALMLFSECAICHLYVPGRFDDSYSSSAAVQRLCAKLGTPEAVHDCRTVYLQANRNQDQTLPPQEF